MVDNGHGHFLHTLLEFEHPQTFQIQGNPPLVSFLGDSVCGGLWILRPPSMLARILVSQPNIPNSFSFCFLNAQRSQGLARQPPTSQVEQCPTLQRRRVSTRQPLHVTEVEIGSHSSAPQTQFYPHRVSLLSTPNTPKSTSSLTPQHPKHSFTHIESHSSAPRVLKVG